MWKNNSFIQQILREANRISKDHTLILSLLLAPLFYAFFYGSIYLNKTEEEVSIAVVDHDHSETSRTFIRMIDETQSVKISLVTISLEGAQKSFMNTKVQGIVYIPRHFEADLKSLKGTDVKLFLNTSRFLPSNDINESVTEVALIIGAGVRFEYYKMHGSSTNAAFEKSMPISIDDRSLYVMPSTYGGFLLPGLLLLILQQTFLIGMAESIAREREKKTISAWLSISGNRIWKAIWGKGLFYLLLFSAYAFFFHVVNYHVLNLPISGSIALLSILLTGFFMVLIMFGTFFGSLFSKEIWALQFFAFSSYPIFLASGYSWPLFALNPALKAFAFMLPTTPALDAYIKIIYKNASILDIQYDLAHLILLGLFYGFLAWWRLGVLKKKNVAEITIIANQ